MAFQGLKLVFTICQVLVITSIGKSKVNAAVQQYEAKIFASGCPNINDLKQVKIKLLQEINTTIEHLCVKSRQTTEQRYELLSTGPGQTTEHTTELLITKQTTEQSMSTNLDPLYKCKGTPGWRQVVFINMTDTSYNCPPGLELTSYSNLRTCGRARSDEAGCRSTIFDVGEFEYSKVCGQIRGYQVGPNSAFERIIYSLDSDYVDGLSLTHGPAGGRQHIWTFAVGFTEAKNQTSWKCPCDTSDEHIALPSFVQNDYFCESGLNKKRRTTFIDIPFLDDPLWDGENCRSSSTCCQFNDPPWFTRTLPNTTNDNIELRICNNHDARRENTAIELIEIYVQ